MPLVSHGCGADRRAKHDMSPLHLALRGGSDERHSRVRYCSRQARRWASRRRDVQRGRACAPRSSARMASLCSGRDRASSMPNSWRWPRSLSAADAVVIPLYDGLGKSISRSPPPIPWPSAISIRGSDSRYGFNHAAAIARSARRRRSIPRAHVWLGRGAGARTQHQRPHHARRQCLALKAIAAAAARSATATPTERALITALATAYSDKPDAERAKLDGAFADAMRAARTYPAHATYRCSRRRRRWNVAVGLLGARQKVGQAPLGRGGSPGRSGHGAQSRPSAGQTTLHHLMENGPIPSAPKTPRPAGEAARRRTPGNMVTCRRTFITGFGRWKDSMRVNVDAARKDEAYIRQADDRASSATAIIRTTSTSSSPRRRWPATCRPRSARPSG